MTANAFHTCGIYNGAAKCWGSFSLLGNSSITQSGSPVQVSGLESKVTAISAGYSHTCAIHDGAAKCWGTNDKGQLGNNSTTNSPEPVQVSGLETGVTAISAGDKHTCAIHNGAAKCWGWNQFYGELGNNSTTNSPVPVQVSGLETGVTAIAASGRFFSCAVHNGAAKCWGINDSGQLGNNSTTDSRVPVQVSGLETGVTSIVTGYRHTCAVHDGAAKCWGYNDSGQLGNDSTTVSRVPVQVSGLETGVTVIATGSTSDLSCAVHNGAAKCWGINDSGQLGNNSTTDSRVPVQVSGLETGVTSIAPGRQHSCGIHNGVAKCWGSNAYGALGIGNFIGASFTPVLVVWSS